MGSRYKRAEGGRSDNQPGTGLLDTDRETDRELDVSLAQIGEECFGCAGTISAHQQRVDDVFGRVATSKSVVCRRGLCARKEDRPPSERELLGLESRDGS